MVKNQIVMKLKKFNGNKTQKLKLWLNSKTEIVITNCDKTEMVMKLKNSNWDNSQQLKLW